MTANEARALTRASYRRPLLGAEANRVWLRAGERIREAALAGYFAVSIECESEEVAQQVGRALIWDGYTVVQNEQRHWLMWSTHYYVLSISW